MCSRPIRVLSSHTPSNAAIIVDTSTEFALSYKQYTRFPCHSSSGLCSFGILQLCAEDAIPESARDPKAILVVCKVVLKMILLQLFVVRRQIAVVKKVVGQVVADVPEYAP